MPRGFRIAGGSGTPNTSYKTLVSVRSGNKSYQMWYYCLFLSFSLLLFLFLFFLGNNLGDPAISLLASALFKNSSIISLNIAICSYFHHCLFINIIWKKTISVFQEQQNWQKLSERIHRSLHSTLQFIHFNSVYSLFTCSCFDGGKPTLTFIQLRLAVLSNSTITETDFISSFHCFYVIILSFPFFSDEWFWQKSFPHQIHKMRVSNNTSFIWSVRPNEITFSSHTFFLITFFFLFISKRTNFKFIHNPGHSSIERERRVWGERMNRKKKREK